MSFFAPEGCSCPHTAPHLHSIVANHNNVRYCTVQASGGQCCGAGRLSSGALFDLCEMHFDRTDVAPETQQPCPIGGELLATSDYPMHKWNKPSC